MINTNSKKIAELQNELNETNAKLKAATDALTEMKEAQEAEAHANVQTELIGEFEMSQDDFNAKLIVGMQSPAVVDYMSRMLQNAMQMGLGR